MNNYLSGRGAAKRLKVSYTTVHRWAQARKIEPLGKLENGTFVFDPAYIEQVKEQLSAKSAA